MVKKRWDTIYNADQLRETIREIAQKAAIEKWFYSPTVHEPATWCQGDVLHVRAQLPFLNADAQVRVSEVTHEHWVLVGNSCDLDREINENPWTWIAPIMHRDNVTPEKLKELKSFTGSYRQMFWPAWSNLPLPTERTLYIDWSRLCTIHRQALRDSGPVQRTARLSFPGWVLFHCALVRFLARDDGRFD